MYAIRVLPLGIPIAAGVSTTGDGAVIVLALLGLMLMLLAVQSLQLRSGNDT